MLEKVIVLIAVLVEVKDGEDIAGIGKQKGREIFLYQIKSSG